MKRNRLLVIAVPLIVILLFLVSYEYGYLGVQEEVAGIKEEEAVKIRTLQKYIAYISEGPELEKTLQTLREGRKADEAKITTGQTVSLATASLQEVVKGTVTGRGGTIFSERIGKAEEHGPFKVISVSVDALVPDMRVLTDILYTLETRTPYLVVKQLDTRVRNFRAPKELVIKMEVAAITNAK